MSWTCSTTAVGPAFGCFRRGLWPMPVRTPFFATTTRADGPQPRCSPAPWFSVASNGRRFPVSDHLQRLSSDLRQGKGGGRVREIHEQRHLWKIHKPPESETYWIYIFMLRRAWLTSSNRWRRITAKPLVWTSTSFLETKKRGRWFRQTSWIFEFASCEMKASVRGLAGFVNFG